MVALSGVRTAIAASCVIALADGFAVVPSTKSGDSTQLYGRRVMKRGTLGSIDDEEARERLRAAAQEEEAELRREQVEVGLEAEADALATFCSRPREAV